MAEIHPLARHPEIKLSAPKPLSAEDDLSAFDCGDPSMNDWLRFRALKNESRFSRTHVVCDQRQVAGYFCISAGTVTRAPAPRKLRPNEPDTIPISVITHLAVSRAHTGRGIGRSLLSFALQRIAQASQSIGVGGVLAVAKDETAKNFYLHCAEFIQYPGENRALFLPIEAILAGSDHAAT